MKKNEEMVYQEVTDYINAPKHNKPCMLQSIKKDLRTPKIIELIFSRPDIFNLEIEVQHIPKEYMNKEITKHIVFSAPKLLAKKNSKDEFIIPEECQTYEVFLAFYFSRAMIQQKQRNFWYGSCDDIYDNENSIKYKDELLYDLGCLFSFIIEKTGKDPIKLKTDTCYEYLNEYIKQKDICNYVDANYEKKYDTITIGYNKPLLIAVEEKSPVFSKHLANSINNSFFAGNINFNLKLIEILEEHEIVIAHDPESFFDFFGSKDGDSSTVTIKNYKYNSDHDFYKVSIKMPKNYENNIDRVTDDVIDEIISKLSLEPEQGASSKKFVRKTKKDQ